MRIAEKGRSGLIEIDGCISPGRIGPIEGSLDLSPDLMLDNY